MPDITTQAIDDQSLTLTIDRVTHTLSHSEAQAVILALLPHVAPQLDDLHEGRRLTPKQRLAISEQWRSQWKWMALTLSEELKAHRAKDQA